MVQINPHLFFYRHVHRVKKGGMGCDMFIVNGSKSQAQIDLSTHGGGIDEIKYQEMCTDKIDVTRTEHIFVTHCHPDHVRGLPFWIQKIGKNVPVYTHTNGVEYLRNPDSYMQDLNRIIYNYRNEISKLPERPSLFVTNWLWGKAVPYQNVLTLRDHQEFDLGGVKVRAIWTPGHAMDHIAYEVQCTDDTDPKKYLISGDLISFKDMKDGKGLIPLASFNNPLSSYQHELNSLNKIAMDPPDCLLSGHYGRFEPKERVKEYLQGAIEEGKMLWDRTIDILLKQSSMDLRKLTKKVIYFKKYLSGVSTRTSSMFVILKEMILGGILRIDYAHQGSFALIPSEIPSEG